MASDDDLIVFEDADIVLGEDGQAIIIAELGERDESASFEVVKFKSLLCNVTEMLGKREFAHDRGDHGIAASGEDSRTTIDGCPTFEVDGVLGHDEGAGGA